MKVRRNQCQFVLPLAIILAEQVKKKQRGIFVSGSSTSSFTTDDREGAPRNNDTKCTTSDD